MKFLILMSYYFYTAKKLNLDLKNRPTSPTKPFDEKSPALEYKLFPDHLYYDFLGKTSMLLVIVVADFVEWQVESFVLMLRHLEREIKFTITNII